MAASHGSTPRFIYTAAEVEALDRAREELRAVTTERNLWRRRARIRMAWAIVLGLALYAAILTAAT